jgi:hypothetical protein
MPNRHTNIFVTFSPTDLAAVTAYITALETAFPSLNLAGRHQRGCDIPAAIDTSTLTLILETSRTHTSSDVREDLRASLAKNPPNAVVRIQLEEFLCDSSTALGTALGTCGAEIVSADPALVEEAIERSAALYRIQPQITEAATHNTADASCNR